MKKKLISAILCAAISAVSIVSSSAASAASDGYTVLKTKTIENNTATFFKYGSDIPETSKLNFLAPGGNVITDPSYEQDFNFTTESASHYLPRKSGYEVLLNNAGNKYNIINFNKTGGTYEKIRIKLSDYSKYFNNNGTHTNTFDDNTHDYNFTKENDSYKSTLVFFSGGAITAVAPDSDGMAEIYFSTKLGQETFFMADFSYLPEGAEKWQSRHSTMTGMGFAGFMIGDVDKNGYIALNDAIFIQKYQVGMETFDSLSARNADANGDGVINLKDTVKVQKYQLGIE